MGQPDEEQAGARVLLRPLLGMAADLTGASLALGEGPLPFSHVELIERNGASRGV